MESGHYARSAKSWDLFMNNYMRKWESFDVRCTKDELASDGAQEDQELTADDTLKEHCCHFCSDVKGDVDIKGDENDLCRRGCLSSHSVP